MPRSIRVVVADEYEIMRQGVRLILEQVPTIRVAGDARTADEAIEITAFVQPDVVIVDVANPEVIRRLKVRNPTVRVLMISFCSDPAFVISALQAGADGYILKQSQSAELIRAVLALGRAEVRQPVVDSHLNLSLRRGAESSAGILSEREREILELVAAGHTSKGIARQLQLSPRTVGNHRARIMTKLRVENCTQAAAQALQLGLIAMPASWPATTAPRLSA
jgi:DNA-binding NarL/FixJ family response regulator